MNAGDTAWVLMCAALVLFMSFGLAIFYAGLEAKRNVLSMLMLNVITIALVSIVWAVIGFTLAFGPDAGHGLIGTLRFAGLRNTGGLWPGTHVPTLTFIAYQMMFAVITPALITGAVAGRMKLGSWVMFCLGWSVIVYPITAHWLFDPQGWLYRFGARDFAGGAVVHASAGAAALVLAALLGPRTKRSAADYRPHSPPLVLLGAGILWFGWFGFNAGSALSAGQLAASAFTGTQLAAASACLVWLACQRLVTGRVTVVGAATGAVVGLATVTPAAGFVSPMSALLIGAVAAGVCFAASQQITRLAWLDDAFGVVSVHGVGGALGMLLLGGFAEHSVDPSGLTGRHGGEITGLVFGDATFLGRQMVAVLAIAGFSALVTYLLARALRASVGLRVPAWQEREGLDTLFDAAGTNPVAVEVRQPAASAAHLR
jgi:Amt family ammonium transporter